MPDGKIKTHPYEVAVIGKKYFPFTAWSKPLIADTIAEIIQMLYGEGTNRRGKDVDLMYVF